jgi:integrase
VSHLADRHKDVHPRIPSWRGRARRRLTIGRYGSLTVDQARQAALTALARVRLGSDPADDKASERASLTVGNLIDIFVTEHVDAKLKAGSAEGYKILLQKLRTVHGGMRATQLTRTHIATMHTPMASKPHTANRFAAVVSKLFSWAIRRELLPKDHVNPATRIDRYKEKKRERFLTINEFGALGDALRAAEAEGVDAFDVAAIRLLMLTGARLREILHAKWEYVDSQRGILFLPDSKTGPKPIYLSSAALAILDGLPRLNSNAHIFPGRKDGAPRYDLHVPWARITSAAGLGALRLHDLRHSFASIGAGSSFGLPIIGKLLGHSEPAATARYAHLSNDPLREASESIGVSISGAMNHKPDDGGARQRRAR